ncbi:MAG TPA: hypothetical protein VIH35_08670 [Kiritimatiellia bacterium]
MVSAHAAWASSTGAVYSVNSMGYQQIAVPASALNLGSVPYGHTSVGINDVIGPQLTPGPDVNSADIAYFFDSGSQIYKVCYLYDDGTNVYWVDNDSQAPATNALLPGVGLWFRSRQATSQTVIALGDVPSDATLTNAVVPGLQLLAYPYPVSVGISQLTISNGATRGFSLDNADTLYVWNASAQNFRIFYYYTDGSLVDYATGDPATNVLQPGEAFWYKHVGSGFSWVEAKPYVWP